MIDVDRGRPERSTEGLPGVAGALLLDAPELVVTSNRGENTIGLFGIDGGGADSLTAGAGRR